jgi:hypothetical protein
MNCIEHFNLTNYVDLQLVEVGQSCSSRMMNWKAPVR